MHTLRLNVQDSVFDKIMYFLKNLPRSEVEVIEEKICSKGKEDFIEYFSSNPVNLDGAFLTRTEANARL